MPLLKQLGDGLRDMRNRGLSSGKNFAAVGAWVGLRRGACVSRLRRGFTKVCSVFARWPSVALAPPKTTNSPLPIPFPPSLSLPRSSPQAAFTPPSSAFWSRFAASATCATRWRPGLPRARCWRRARGRRPCLWVVLALPRSLRAWSYSSRTCLSSVAARRRGVCGTGGSRGRVRRWRVGRVSCARRDRTLSAPRAAWFTTAAWAMGAAAVAAAA